MKCMKLFSLLLTLTAASYLAADDDLSALPENGWDTPTAKTTNNNGQSSSWYNPSKKDKSGKKAKQKNPQRDLFLIDVGAAYLKPYQGGTDFASQVPGNVVGAQGVEYGNNKGLDFDYDWGFRGAIGFQGGKSRRTILANYLYLSSDASKTTISDYIPHTYYVPPSNTAIYVPFLLGSKGFGDYVNSAHSHWNLHFNMLDILFGKKYPRKGCMSFEPFIGAKGVWLSENQTSKYYFIPNDPNPEIVKQTNHLHGAGLVGGLNLDWVLTKWLSFNGSIDAALLYSSVETKRTSNNVVPTLLWVGKSSDIKGVPVIDGSFALRSVYCWKSGRFIDLKIGFEGHYIFETMKHTLLNAETSTDLSLLGWFATLGFGF